VCSSFQWRGSLRPRFRLTTISTTITRIHKYTIRPALLHIAPEIKVEEEQSVWVDVIRAHFEAEDRLTYRKMGGQEMSKYTRWFTDNGAADRTSLQFVIRDLDYDPDSEKPRLFLVQ
jgi:hypothetical protein